jgi:hypothetical protein
MRHTDARANEIMQPNEIKPRIVHAMWDLSHCGVKRVVPAYQVQRVLLYEKVPSLEE